jgi:hypothetical protein
MSKFPWRRLMTVEGGSGYAGGEPMQPLLWFRRRRSSTQVRERLFVGRWGDDGFVLSTSDVEAWLDARSGRHSRIRG